jgi:hypothetical protein
VTLQEAWAAVVAHESGGRLEAIGDDGRACGLGQMWWVFRKDYWPHWAWLALAAADQVAFENCVKRHKDAASVGLRHFYTTIYNPRAVAADLASDPIVF